MSVVSGHANDQLTANYPFSLEDLRKSQQRFANRHEKPKAEPTEAAKAYSEKLAKSGEKEQKENEYNVDSILNRAFRNIERPLKEVKPLMDYDAAKYIVWEIGNKILERDKRKWVVPKEQAETIEHIIRYFINDPKGKHDPQKGIYLFGDVGRGKTFLFDVMKVFCDAVPLTPKRFRIASCSEIADKLIWDKNENNRQMADYHNGIWMFDDLGNEPGAIKTFGNEVPVMERLLTARYQKFTNGICVTHVTSNDMPQELEKKYGTRLFDRANEMFNFVFLRGEYSNRTLVKNIQK